MRCAQRRKHIASDEDEVPYVGLLEGGFEIARPSGEMINRSARRRERFRRLDRLDRIDLVGRAQASELRPR